MPSAPPRVCNRCRKPAERGKPCQCRPAWEGSTHPGNSRRWAGLRAAYLGVHPICEKVEFDPDDLLDSGTRCRRPATEVDHVIPLAEDGEQFEWKNLQALCHQHHAEKTTADALRGKTRLR